MDSIRENQKVEDLITTIRMELNNDIDGQLNLILVEGSDDISFVKRIFNPEVVCYESFAGKKGILVAIQSDEIADERVIAIVDKDYDRETEFPERTWCYDTCCLETMLLSNENVREGMYRTYYKGTKEKEEFFSNALTELAPISILRKRNMDEKLQINLKKAQLADCIEIQSEKIDMEQVFRNVGQDSLQECQNTAKQLQVDELYEYTNGHDICNFLGRLFQSGKGDLGEARVRDIMICSYRNDDFKRTKLFQGILAYQKKYDLRYVVE